MRKFILLFAILVLLSSCIFEVIQNGDDNDLEKIKEVFLHIFDEFTMFDVEGVMSYFSEDFLNDGVDYFEERNIWYDRLGATVDIVSFSTIQINENHAYISFVINYNGVDYSVPLDGEFTDLVYFKKIDDEWKVYGNQQEYPGNYSITVETNPNGASLYLNGTKLDYTSPYTIEDLSAGYYVVGVYVKGYNEVWEEIFLSADTTIYEILEVPSYPTPTFYINSPEDGEIIDDDHFFLSGYVNDYLGNYAILNINGDEQTIEVDGFGDFHQYINVYDEVNEFFLRATNSFGNTGISDDITVYAGTGERELTIEITWNTDATDLDLHIWDPFDNYCFYGDIYGIPNGALQIDDNGYGPEIFLQQPISIGTYRVKAHFYDGYDESNPTSAIVEIRLDGTSYFYGPYEFTGDGDEQGAWWDVVDFTVE